MKTLLLILIIPFLTSSNRVQLKGTYEGTLEGKKVVANFRTTDIIVLGSIYESKNAYHRLRGEIAGDSVSGTLFFNLMLDISYKGIIKEKGKKIEIELYFPANDSISYKSLSLLLSKVNNSTEINFDKFFPTQKVVFIKEYDVALIGKWKLIKTLNASGEDITTKTTQNYSITLYDNGVINILIPKYANTKDIMGQLKIEWYTSGKVLYTEIGDPISGGILKHEEKYEIRGDTLITQNVKGNLHIHIKQ